MVTKYIGVSSSLAVIISFILLITLPSLLCEDLVEEDFLSPHRAIENTDQQNLLAEDIDGFEGLTMTSSHVSTRLISGLAIEASCIFFEPSSYFQESLVLRC